MLNYDLIVIGAGPGGYVAAIKAAQLGKKVALMESQKVGGTCLNRGCVPTKTLLQATDLLQELRLAESMGIKSAILAVDTERLHQYKDEVVERLQGGVEALLQANKVELINGHARIMTSGSVRVEGETYTAARILIATGSKPMMPPIPGLGLPGVVTSDELLRGSETLYRHLIIIGGGVIGVEFAGIYHGLGCRVSIIEKETRILPRMDREISQSLSMVLKKRGIEILTSATLQQVKPSADGLLCCVQVKEEPRQIHGDGLLVAIGRRANTDDLFADNITPNMERGSIVVGEDFQTSIPGVYAIGDVIWGSTQLAHAASAEGINAVCGMFGSAPPYSLDAIPSCIYSSPEIACVGLTETAAKERGIAVKTGKYLTAGNARSVIAQAERGFIKLIFCAKSEKLLGAELICERATDIIAGLTQAVANGLTMAQLSAAVLPHPTFAEGLGEALKAACGQAIHIMPRVAL